MNERPSRNRHLFCICLAYSVHTLDTARTEKIIQRLSALCCGTKRSCSISSSTRVFPASISTFSGNREHFINYCQVVSVGTSWYCVKSSRSKGTFCSNRSSNDIPTAVYVMIRMIYSSCEQELLGRGFTLCSFRESRVTGFFLRH